MTIRLHQELHREAEKVNGARYQLERASAALNGLDTLSARYLSTERRNGEKFLSLFVSRQ